MYEESGANSEPVNESIKSQDIADEDYQQPITPTVEMKMAAPKSKKIKIIPLKL